MAVTFMRLKIYNHGEILTENGPAIN